MWHLYLYGGIPNPPTQVTTHRLVGDAYCIMRRKPLLSNIPDGGHADSGHPLWQIQGHLHSLFDINRRNDTFVESFDWILFPNRKIVREQVVDKTIELRICNSSSKLRSSQVPRPLIPLFCNSLYSWSVSVFSTPLYFFAFKPLTFVKSLPDLFTLGCLSALGSSSIYISQNSKGM